jgi:hypothetical protein
MYERDNNTLITKILLFEHSKIPFLLIPQLSGNRRSSISKIYTSINAISKLLFASANPFLLFRRPPAIGAQTCGAVPIYS